ncbi:NUDIX hydrolase [Cellulomonas citrea]|uniref:NUDIX hydrolase n=1 Tax=Cellulomonas citrea TaxID=1909423 RepID=UPI00135A052A|nr:NUDIX hydrolase [Cellulomonas citrea]
MTSGTTSVQAAGALVWRVRTGRLQVALVHRPRYRDWSWPKGKLEPGECVVEAATREVAEETGLDVVLGMPLPGLQYESAGRPKQVHYWAAQVAGRPDRFALAARPPVPRAGRDEIDQVRWFDADVAAQRLTRPSDREPLDVLVEAYRQDRLVTRALVVARHGRATKRAHWAGTELDRPLTRSGTRQATGLVPLLSAFGVARVVSSRWARCEQTVRPYATAAGLELVTSDLLTEDAHADSPARVAAEMLDLLSVSGDSVVCTHRPVLPTVLDVLAGHACRAVADALPTADPFLRPGQVLVCHVAETAVGPRVVAAQVLAPSS